ncbi:PIG-L family deacetylase [Daejeonella oryzae]|uniref:PIG-L family deacetylase n=1 Tax=Daejeonella oryzae TaxID=1122943 RepID=UPI0004150220|nr:PIG-L family deacetylase [Daejeonella oryzae]
MKLSILIFFFLGIFSASIFAQTSPGWSSSEIKQGMQKLAVTASALYIAAHPDDENTRLLAYLSKERNVRTGYLALTRGDGGQNLIGNEQAELLGLIRTQELLAARSIDGAEQFFTRANDFGYSKTSDETFKFWGKEQILADAVWVIRKFRPDVIITRFPEDSRAGHGHHAASAIIAREAFVAAADPKRFPEQLKHVQTWQATRIVWNTFNFGGTNTTSEDQLKIDVGGFNPLSGKSYGEVAAESRSRHRSQGFGSAAQRGQMFEYFSPVAGKPASKDLFDDVDLSWNKIKGGANIQKLINQINQNFLNEDPSKSVSQLVKLLTDVEDLNPSSIKDKKEEEIKDLIISCAGLWFESYAAEPSYSVNDSIKIRSQVIVRSSKPVLWKSLSGKTINTTLKNGIMVSAENSALANEISEPYWLAANHPVGYYLINDQQLVGNPENINPIQTTFSFSINGKDLTFHRPVVYKYTDQVRGEIYQPMIIAPPVTASIAEKSYVFAAKNSRTIQVQLKSFRNNTSGILKPIIPKGWKISPQEIEFAIAKKGDEQIKEFILSPSGEVKSGNLSINIHLDSQKYNRGLKVVNYDHIPLQTLFPVTEVRVERLDLNTDGKKIGYMAGAGDLIPESLKQIGYEVILLSENEILIGSLNSYDAIIAGVRAYNVNERLKYLQPKLMEYVKNGGTYLVQYNVNNPLLVNNIGPYPFKISRDRVTDEEAAVTFIDPKSKILNYPNKITPDDFNGWIQERGIYFVSDFDPEYRSILKMSDAGESPNAGSLIVADYGKGKFVYTSLAFFRQLPAGVPGAYRLFVNLLAKNQ